MLDIQCNEKVGQLSQLVNMLSTKVPPEVAQALSAEMTDLATPTYSGVTGLPLLKICQDEPYKLFYKKVVNLCSQYAACTETAVAAAKPPSSVLGDLGDFIMMGLYIGIGYIGYKWVTAAAGASSILAPKTNRRRRRR